MSKDRHRRRGTDSAGPGRSDRDPGPMTPTGGPGPGGCWRPTVRVARVTAKTTDTGRDRHGDSACTGGPGHCGLAAGQGAPSSIRVRASESGVDSEVPSASAWPPAIIRWGGIISDDSMMPAAAWAARARAPCFFLVSRRRSESAWTLDASRRGSNEPSAYQHEQYLNGFCRRFCRE